MKGLSKFLLFILLLAVAAFAVACYQLNKPPQEVWNEQIAYIKKQIEGPPPPLIKPKPAQAPVGVAPVIPTPKTTTPVVKAPLPPPQDPLSWARDHQNLAPQDLTLLVDTTFPIVYNGHLAGSGNLPIGNVVRIVHIDPEKKIVTVDCAAYGDSTKDLPIASTDLLERAKVAMAQAAEDAKGKAQPVVVATPSTPAPVVVSTPAPVKPTGAVVSLISPNHSVTEHSYFGVAKNTSGSGNAMDRIDFGDMNSEQEHKFEPDYADSDMPAQGVGVFSQTYRKPIGTGLKTPTGSQALVFTMKCDPDQQNYLSVKLWGSDPPCSMILKDSFGMEQGWGPVVFPNRFYYYTVPIPIKWTQGSSSVQLTLFFPDLQPKVATRPIYSAFTHTESCFVPADTDVVGSAPSQKGQATLRTLTAEDVTRLLVNNRKAIYQGGFYQWVLGEQIMKDTMEDSTNRVPKETVGLAFWHALANWQGQGHNDDDWRNDTASQMGGIGYTGFPEELISAFTATYLLPPLIDGSGNQVTGLDHYHDPMLLQRIVSAFDGCTYQQGSNGGFPHQGDNWIGITSTPRGDSNQWPGTTTRQETKWGAARCRVPMFRRWAGRSFNYSMIRPCPHPGEQRPRQISWTT